LNVSIGHLSFFLAADNKKIEQMADGSNKILAAAHSLRGGTYASRTAGG
jgi:hypothetical protein